MKNHFSLLLSVTMLFIGLLTGFFIGRNYTREAITISVPPQMLQAPTLPPETEPAVVFPIDINKADKADFMALPRIGETLTGRILAYRRERGNLCRFSYMRDPGRSCGNPWIDHAVFTHYFTHIQGVGAI